MRLFVTTGDFIFRNEWENFTKTTRDLFVKNGVKHESVDVEIVKKEFPQFDLRGITACLYENEAGVVRARRSTQCVAEVFQKLGGDVVVARGYPGPLENGRMGSLLLNTHDTVKAQNYVFAVGPWLGKTFPGLMGPRMRQPIGRVCYFATPHGDNRFEFPNMPSFNFPGVTGWPTLPFDSDAHDDTETRRWSVPPRPMLTMLASTGSANPSSSWTLRLTPTRAFHVRPTRRVTAASPVRRNASPSSCGVNDEPEPKLTVVRPDADTGRL